MHSLYGAKNATPVSSNTQTQPQMSPQPQHPAQNSVLTVNNINSNQNITNSNNSQSQQNKLASNNQSNSSNNFLGNGNGTLSPASS